MALTAIEVIRQIRSLIDEPSPALASDADILAWINQAQRDIARKAECLEQSATLPVTSLQQTVTAPVDTIRIHEVKYQPTGQTFVYPLEYREKREMNYFWGTYPSQSSAYPNYWTSWGISPSAIDITLFPVPAQAGNLLVYYYRFPADIMFFTSPLDIPGGWEDAVVQYCSYLYKMKSKDKDWTDHYKIYNETLTDLINRTTQYTDATTSIMRGGRTSYYGDDDLDY